LLVEWQYLVEARNLLALQQLEFMRARKEIGKSLEAELRLRYNPTTADASTLALAKYETSLAELFGLSQVTVKPAGVSHESVAQFAEGHPEKSSNPKCERCWRHVPDVGDNAAYPSVCLRCVEALDAIDFPPYPATPAPNEQRTT
jgi:isoleucyl-tRNA synthetase